MKHKLLPFYLYGTLGLMSILMLLVGFWVFYPYKVMDFHSPYKMERTSYIQGDETFYIVDYCKYTDKMPTIQKEFVDGLVFTAESPQAFLTEGCRKQEVPLLIPHTLPSGKYRLKISTQYQMNPIRSIDYVNYSEWFTVSEEHQDLEQDIKAMEEANEL
jgi:hypothetical protein